MVASRKLKVVTVGPHIIDIHGYPVPDLPKGQGGVLLDQIRLSAAGTAAGAAVDLAKLGVQVQSCGAVGDDHLGALLVAIMTDYGIDLSGLVKRSGLPTSATILPIRPNGDRPSMHVPGAGPTLGPEDIDAGLALDADAFLLGGVDTLPKLATEEGVALVQKVHGAGVAVFADLLGAASGVFDQIAGLLPFIDWFMPNEDQLANLTGYAEPKAGAEALLAAGVGAVAVTLGPEGALVVRRDCPDLRVPAFEVQVMDTTGCGDAFNAGVITGLSMGCDPGDAALLGCACGALVATGLGSDAGIVDLEGTLELVATRFAATAERIAQRCSS